MSRTALLEKIKKAEAVASSEIEDAEKEQNVAMNRIPLDQEELMKKKRDAAEKSSRKEIDDAMKEITKQKGSILKKGESENAKMKSNAEGNIDKAAKKFVDKFLESLS